LPYLQEVRATFSPKAGSAFEHVALGKMLEGEITFQLNLALSSGS